MIEVKLVYPEKNEKLKGIIENNQYYYKKMYGKNIMKKPWAHVEDNIFFYKKKPALIVDSSGAILDLDAKKEILGYVRDNKIFRKGETSDLLLISFSNDEIYDEVNNHRLFGLLKGDIKNLKNHDYVFIISFFFGFFQ